MVLLGSVSSVYAIPVSILESQENITLMTIINQLLEENQKLHEEGARRLEKSEIAMLTNYREKPETQYCKAGCRLGGNRYCKTYKSRTHNDVDC
jgi:hypothetical protein